MADDKAKIDWKMLESSVAEPASEEVAPASPAPAPAPAAAAAAAVAAVVAGAPPANKIVFYCSNGHRVVVAATMSGQRGKCSKCGVAVRIPASSQSAAVPARPAEQHAGGADLATAAEPPAEEEPSRVTTSDSNVSATEFVELSHQVSDPGEQPPQEQFEAGQGGAALPVNPTAALVTRLFQEMEHGGIVEVHIAGGSVILPEFYEPRWSAGSHGLFASRAADGTVTLTAVAWDSIQKIIVRQVNGLPDGMFE